jgi:hypothetical protein
MKRRYRSEMGQIWWVTYGSNLATARFRCYLVGGRPAGSARDHDGCRDPSDPARAKGVAVPGGVVFASRCMGRREGAFRQGVGRHRVLPCLPDLRRSARDIAAQERRRPPGGEFGRDLAGLLPDVRRMVAPAHGYGATGVARYLLAARAWPVPRRRADRGARRLGVRRVVISSTGRQSRAWV